MSAQCLRKLQPEWTGTPGRHRESCSGFQAVYWSG